GGSPAGADRGPARRPSRGGVDGVRDLRRERRPHLPGRADRPLGELRPARTRDPRSLRARPGTRPAMVRLAARAGRAGASQRRTRGPRGARTVRTGVLPRHPERGRPAPAGRQRGCRGTPRQHPSQPLPGRERDRRAWRGGRSPTPLPQLRLAPSSRRGLVRRGAAGRGARSGVGGGALVRPLPKRRDVGPRLPGRVLALRGAGERGDRGRGQPGTHAALAERALLAAGEGGRGLAAARQRGIRL
ncbi:MAG: NAD-dependent protein deacetylase of SIR2 family, partial [uncultured Rubrobacteraceae bacterium]